MKDADLTYIPDTGLQSLRVEVVRHKIVVAREGVRSYLLFHITYRLLPDMHRDGAVYCLHDSEIRLYQYWRQLSNVNGPTGLSRPSKR